MQGESKEILQAVKEGMNDITPNQISRNLEKLFPKKIKELEQYFETLSGKTNCDHKDFENAFNPDIA